MALKFEAMVGDEPAECGTIYSGLGTTAEAAEILDLRFYVYNVRLIDDAGMEVPLALEQDGVWQVENVAMLDFEDGTGACADTGTTNLRSEVRGTAPAGNYVGVAFDVGVPFDMNHDDLAAAPAPLNVSAMYWAWAIGHKFVRVDLQTGEGLRWNMHLGSTMCESDGPMDPPSVECGRPNIISVRLDSFDLASDAVMFDVAALFGASDLTQDTPDTASGCQSFPTDVNECTSLFPQLGLDFESGDCVGDCAGQAVFKVMPQSARPTDGHQDGDEHVEDDAAVERGEVVLTSSWPTVNGTSTSCTVCHGPMGAGGIGPDIRVSTQAHLQEHAQGTGPHPEGVKFAELTEEEFHDLAAYLASLCEADPDCEAESVDEHDHD
jgi:uncharacterized repeat protein (TIGR04052 family)